MTTDVLVLDPDRSSTAFLESRLVLEGYAVESVSSLEEGVAVARAASPWLVVTHADSAEGLVFCNEVKSDPALSHVLVVMVSSEVPGEHLLRHWLNGGSRADLYVRRPLGNAFFGACLEKWLLDRADTTGFHDEKSTPLGEISAELDSREAGLTKRELELNRKESALVERESKVDSSLETLRRDEGDTENAEVIARMGEEARATDEAIAKAREEELADVKGRLIDVSSSVVSLRSELEEAGASTRAAQEEANEARAELDASARIAKEAERIASVARKAALDAERAVREASAEAERAMGEAAAAQTKTQEMRAQLVASQSETDLIKSALEQGKSLVDQARSAHQTSEMAHTATKEELAEALLEVAKLQKALENGRVALVDGENTIDGLRTDLEEAQGALQRQQTAGAEALRALGEVREQLTASQAERREARQEAAAAKAEWTRTKTEASGVQARYTKTLADLERCRADLDEARRASGSGAAEREPRAGLMRGPELERLFAAVAQHEATLAQSRVTWSGLAGRVGRAVQTLLQTTQKFPETSRGLFPLLHQMESVLKEGAAIVAGHTEALKEERLAADALDKVLD